MLTFILCRCTLSSVWQDGFVTSVLSNMQFCNEHVMFVLLALGGGGGAGSLIVTWISKVVLEIRCISRAGVYFWLINYSLGNVNCLCQSTCFCSCRCSTTIMKRMKQATLFGILVDYSLSGWFVSRTLGLQEWFVQINQSAQTNIMKTPNPRGVASHPIHSTPPPPNQPLGWRWLYGSKYVCSSKVSLKFRGTGGNFI